MSIDPDQFYKSSPGKVVQQAQRFSKTLNKFYEAPKSPVKKNELKEKAEYYKQIVNLAVQQGSFQNELYRSLETKDQTKRIQIQEKLKLQNQKVKQNQETKNKKMTENIEKYNKHIQEVYKRYQEEQKRIKSNKFQKAISLRNELKKFYEQEAKRKRLQEQYQVSTDTCYRDAVEKINRQHLESESFSIKSERQLQMKLEKNNKKESLIMKKSRCLSTNNEKKNEALQNCEEILKQKEFQFIQKYGKDMDQSLIAFQKKDDDKEKVRKRIHDHLKKKNQSWSECKKRVDASKAQTPHKCTHILDKTQKSQWRMTMSSFRTNSKWDKVVKKNKQLIKERDQRQKDKILEIHEDLRLRNSAGFGVKQKMDSFRAQARVTARSYL